MQYEASGGLILLLCVVIALLITNLPFGPIYLMLWETSIGFTIGSFTIEHSLSYWINDFLMVFFFFLIGLEIKREVLIGELSNPVNAITPVIAALGGMIVPAAIFLAVNPPGTPGANAWAIPIATDIAIVLGILSVFGKRIPTSLKIFVTTLAIVDDIGGVLVLAIVYSHGVSILHLVLAVLILSVLILINRVGVRQILPYAILGIMVWFEFLLSGVPPTIAGILIAFTIPATTKIDLHEYSTLSSELVRNISTATTQDPDNVDIVLVNNLSRTLKLASKDIEAPLEQIEQVLTKWIAFGIIPIFALANAGVMLSGINVSLLLGSVPIGIILGLVIGKPVGVILSVWIGIRIGFIKLPNDVNWDMLISSAFLTGIGFTISTFIASLAITDIELLAASKVGILIASFISGCVGFISLRYVLRKREIAMIPYVSSEIDKTPNIIIHTESGN
ncbi:MAG: Na+/H+ antiporter NhaA [Candidatus Thorarchaeota archaeon]|nr:MAG: Na+/H+ antiporter NhaA [Candidatus Thorarchaeota archaeon]